MCSSDLIAHFDRASARAAGMELWQLAENKPTALVFGGSQGARHLNEVVAAAAPELIKAGYQILHSVGRNNSDHLVTGLPGYVTVPYIERMDFAYGVAAVAVTRAGAMTVAELTAVGLPAVYVPLPIGNGEQKLNAEPVVSAGGGVIVDDANFTAEVLIETLSRWKAEGFDKRSQAAAGCGRINDIETFVSIILAAAQSKGQS